MTNKQTQSAGSSQAERQLRRSGKTKATLEGLRETPQSPPTARQQHKAERRNDSESQQGEEEHEHDSERQQNEEESGIDRERQPFRDERIYNRNEGTLKLYGQQNPQRNKGDASRGDGNYYEIRNENAIELANTSAQIEAANRQHGKPHRHGSGKRKDESDCCCGAM